MSYDLNFWKYKEGVPHDNSKVYEHACCQGEELEELERLPVDEILNIIAEKFSHWTALDKFSYESSKSGSFEISVTSQTVRFDCYNMSGEDMNVLMDILFQFGCPLYDSGISTRFDSWTDR